MGVPGMSSGWGGSWVTAPSPGASDFGVTQGPARPPRGAHSLGWHHRGVLGSSCSVSPPPFGFFLFLSVLSFISSRLCHAASPPSVRLSDPGELLSRERVGGTLCRGIGGAGAQRGVGGSGGWGCPAVPPNTFTFSLGQQKEEAVCAESQTGAGSDLGGHIQRGPVLGGSLFWW